MRARRRVTGELRDMRAYGRMTGELRVGSRLPLGKARQFATAEQDAEPAEYVGARPLSYGGRRVRPP
jgi:hypothetical protein